MIEFTPGGSLTWNVRMWIGDSPEGAALPAEGDRVTLSVRPASIVMPSRTRVAIEALQRRGPRSVYGLLGAELSPGAGGELHVVVPTGPSSAGPYPGSLAGRLDAVTVGATREYADAVLAGIREAQAAGEELPGGRLSIICMAHGAVGSSPAVFRALAKAVVRLLVRGGPPQTPDEAAALLR